MKIKTCFITAAGFGTRMGEVGKRIPKPLWPVFSKTLLDLQLDYAKNLGIENIYINSHHQSELIAKWAMNKNVTLLKEDIILGSGGCVHNLYEHIDNKEETILIINSDQFYFFDKSYVELAYQQMINENSCAHLIGIKVDKSEKYNETIIEKDSLIKIDKPRGEEDYITYSGVGLIDLSKLKYQKGVSGFFDSVCNFKENHIVMTTPSESEYWDFGTKEKYLSAMFNVLKSETSLMYSFLKENNVFDEDVEINESDNMTEIVLNSYKLKLIKKGESLTLIEM